MRSLDEMIGKSKSMVQGFGQSSNQTESGIDRPSLSSQILSTFSRRNGGRD